MRIFIDCTHTSIFKHKNTGIHRVVRSLIEELSTYNSKSVEIIPVKFTHYFITRVDNLGYQVIHSSIRNIQYFCTKLINKIKRLVPDILLRNIRFCEVFENRKFSEKDIYLIADANWDLPIEYYYFLKHLKTKKVKVSVICYDLIPLKFPEFCSQKFADLFKSFYYKYSDCFDQVICISHQSAKDYEEILGKREEKGQVITCFELGANYINENLTKDFEENISDFLRDMISHQYILVVGSLVPHKNIKTVIVAFDLLLQNTLLRPHLVFAGNKGWHLDTDFLIESHPQYNQLIHIFNSISDFELSILYKNCYLLVQASFYEGYGLPVVEAMQYQKPVICSNGGSLPEVGGEFCFYFNPYKAEELYKLLVDILSSPKQYEAAVHKIKTKYKPVTWAESAQQLFNILTI